MHIVDEKIVGLHTKLNVYLEIENNKAINSYLGCIIVCINTQKLVLKNQ